MSGPSAPISLAEVAGWIGLAFALWLVLIATLRRFGVAAAPIIAAPISWVLACAVLYGLPQLVRWAAAHLAISG